MARVREKTKGKGQLARNRRRWEDSIKIDRNEIGWELVDWIDLAQVKVKQPHYRPGVAQRVPGIKVPRFHDNGTGWW